MNELTAERAHKSLSWGSIEKSSETPHHHGTVDEGVKSVLIIKRRRIEVDDSVLREVCFSSR